MLLLTFLRNHQFVHNLLSPVCKPGYLALWARAMADVIAQNNAVLQEDAPKIADNIPVTNGTAKHPLDATSDVSASKKLKTDSEKDVQNAESGRRRKVALLLAYCGHGYYGMQKNPGMKTIEDDLLMALLKAGLINQENFDIPQTMQFQRAARTDKGVSAARQIVSLRIPISEDLVEKINAHLPSVIKVMSIKRTTKGFNAKHWCDARTYSYTLPTFAFAPITEKTTEDYRITDDVIDRVNSVIKLFKGTHNFHNFTSKRKPEDKSAQRYIMEFESGKPFIDGNMELLTITVKGQSFMLHQIRKMIGLTIAILRDLASIDVIEKAWNYEKLDVPIAPGVGLMLEQVHYEKYNKRYANDGLHNALEWDDLEETIGNFKKDHIWLPLLAAEKEDKSMLQWLATLPLHTYGVRSDDKPRSGTRGPLGKAMVAIELALQSENQVEVSSDSIETRSESLTEDLDAKLTVQPEDLLASTIPSLVQQ